jgi:hypothetical protein
LTTFFLQFDTFPNNQTAKSRQTAQNLNENASRVEKKYTEASSITRAVDAKSFGPPVSSLTTFFLQFDTFPNYRTATLTIKLHQTKLFLTPRETAQGFLGVSWRNVVYFFSDRS